MIEIYQKAFLCVDNVEESKEEVEGHMKKRLKSDCPDLHEAGAVVLVLRLEDDLEEKEDEEGAEDDGDSDGRGEGEAEKPLKEKW